MKLSVSSTKYCSKHLEFISNVKKQNLLIQEAGERECYVYTSSQLPSMILVLRKYLLHHTNSTCTLIPPLLTDVLFQILSSLSIEAQSLDHRPIIEPVEVHSFGVARKELILEP